jgi:ankyrin repeat protein
MKVYSKHSKVCNPNSAINVALIEAVISGSEELVNEAYQLGADINCIVNSNLINPLKRRSLFEKLALVTSPNYISSNDNISGLSALYIACSQGFTSIAKRLLDLGANLRSNNDFNPLVIACANAHVEVVKLLLSRGAVADEISTKYRNTNLHFACKNDCIEIVDNLINYGASINAVNRFLHTPLHIACIEGHVNLVEFLIDKGADIHLKSSTGWSALLWACYHHHSSVIQLLLVKGSNINDRNKIGNLIIEEPRFRENGCVPPSIKKWPFIMGILILKEFCVYHIIDASTLIELRDYL